MFHDAYVIQNKAYLGGEQGGKHLPLPVPLLQPPVPFRELSSASRFFSNDLAMLLC